MSQQITVSPEEDGLRLDQLLVRRLADLSRRGASRLIADGGVRLAGKSPPKSTPVRAGDVVELELTAELLDRARPVDVPPTPAELADVTLVHQDEHLTVVNKPAGRSTHPLAPEEDNTVANHLAWADPRCLTVGGPAREGGLCHRLDKLTSGLLVAARTPDAYHHLRQCFTVHEVDKGYVALVHGAPPDTGEVTVPINSVRGQRQVQTGSGQPAQSRYSVIERYGEAALVEVTTRTGRRHQVRAHLAHAGHPLVDDKTYGGKPMEGWSLGPLLHAHQLAFPHPADKSIARFEAPLWVQQRAALDRIQKG